MEDELAEQELPPGRQLVDALRAGPTKSGKRLMYQARLLLAMSVVVSLRHPDRPLLAQHYIDEAQRRVDEAREDCGEAGVPVGEVHHLCGLLRSRLGLDTPDANRQRWNDALQHLMIFAGWYQGQVQKEVSGDGITRESIDGFFRSHLALTFACLGDRFGFPVTEDEEGGGYLLHCLEWLGNYEEYAPPGERGHIAWLRQFLLLTKIFIASNRGEPHDLGYASFQGRRLGLHDTFDAALAQIGRTMGNEGFDAGVTAINAAYAEVPDNVEDALHHIAN